MYHISTSILTVGHYYLEMFDKYVAITGHGDKRSIFPFNNIFTLDCYSNYFLRKTYTIQRIEYKQLMAFFMVNKTFKYRQVTFYYKTIHKHTNKIKKIRLASKTPTPFITMHENALALHACNFNTEKLIVI